MNMNKKELEAFAKEAAKGIKTPEDLNEFSQMLKKITVEAALNAEMDEHLGYEKHQKSTSSNSRNGKSSKRVKTEDGEFELDNTLTSGQHTVTINRKISNGKYFLNSLSILKR